MVFVLSRYYNIIGLSLSFEDLGKVLGDEVKVVELEIEAKLKLKRCRLACS